MKLQKMINKVKKARVKQNKSKFDVIISNMFLNDNFHKIKLIIWHTYGAPSFAKSKQVIKLFTKSM